MMHDVGRGKKGAVEELRPGITGWAQVNGRDNLSNEQKMPRCRVSRRQLCGSTLYYPTDDWEIYPLLEFGIKAARQVLMAKHINASIKSVLALTFGTRSM